MLLLVSSTILSQNSDTRNISDVQIAEIYKGLKQSDYLKLRLQKTDNALNSAIELNKEQEKALAVSKSMLHAKDEIIATTNEICKQDKTAGIERENQLKSDISILRGDLSIMEIESKQKQRKKFWGGVKVGAVGTVILGAVAGFLIMNNQ